MFHCTPRSEDRVPQAALRGREAYVSGQPITTCPYALGSCDAMLWIQNWIQEDCEDDEAIHALISERGRLGK
jgi:ribosome modulation factor